MALLPVKGLSARGLKKCLLEIAFQFFCFRIPRMLLQLQKLTNSLQAPDY